jgi:uncharacterized protein (TIGR02300 family)
MKREDWGIKRICLSCNLKFYDFNKSPIVCPSCSATFDLESFSRKRVKISRDKSNDVDDIKIDAVNEILADDNDDNDDIVDIDEQNDDEEVPIA